LTQAANLAPIDWAIVATYLLFALGVGLVFRKRAGTSMADYFLSGRNVSASARTEGGVKTPTVQQPHAAAAQVFRKS
jgi:hypothetical protein